MKFTFVNMSKGSSYFEVHRAGCSDIKLLLGSRGLNGRAGNNSYDVEADNAEAAIKAEMEEFKVNEQEFGREDFHVAPCCKKENAMTAKTAKTTVASKSTKSTPVAPKEHVMTAKLTVAISTQSAKLLEAGKPVEYNARLSWFELTPAVAKALVVKGEKLMAAKETKSHERYVARAAVAQLSKALKGHK